MQGGLSLNGLDFAILFTFLAVIGLGFFGGIVRVTAAIVAIYVASVVSAMFYVPLADAFQNNVKSINQTTSQLLVFLVTFMVAGGIVWWMVSSGLKGSKMPRRLEIFDNLGGATLGMIVSVMAVTLAVMLISILLQVLNQSVGAGGTTSLGGAVKGQIDTSALVPLFLDLSPVFTRIIEPWFPSGLPAILG